MKRIKIAAFSIIIAFILLILFRHSIYNNLISYKPIGERTDFTANNENLIRLIENSGDLEKNLGIEQIVKLSLKITSKQLTFTSEKSDIDPKLLIVSRHANCIGYATFFSTTCNYLLKKHGLSETWTAKAKIGELYILSVNLHQYFNSAFFKDHDFVIIENKATGELIILDPSLYDYCYINQVTLKN